MGDLMRRRAMMADLQSGGTWYPLSGNSFLSWARGTRVQVSGQSIHFYPNSLSWSASLTANGLQFKWGQIKNGTLHFSCDYTLTGRATGGNLPFSVGAYSNNSPTGSTARSAYGNIEDIVSDGEGTVDVTIPIRSIVFESGTPSDEEFFGIRIYAHTGANSHVYLSNIVFEVQI